MRRLLPLALCLLTGCATYHAQPLAPADLARRFEHRSLADAGLHDYVVRALGHDITPWPPAQWNRRLLTLAAWYDNPALEIVRARAATARAGIDVAGALPNPTLQLPFEYATPNPGPGAPFSLGLALDIPIETAGKRGYRVDQARHLSDAAQLSIETEAWKVSGQVRDALTALYSAQSHRSSLARRVADERQVVAMIERRHSVGENSAADVGAATLAMDQAQHDFATADAALSDARAQLAAAIGVPLAAIDGIRIDPASFATPPSAPPAPQAQRDAIFHRSDLLASLADYAAAESALQLEVAKQYPDLHLGPGYTYDTGTRRIAFGLAGITLPIFDQNRGGIREAEGKRKEAAARTAALQEQIIGELDQALSRYRLTLHALDFADAQLNSAKRQLAGEAARFAVGEIDRLAYTKAKIDLEISDVSRLDALVTARQAAAALEDAMQRPLDREGFSVQLHRRDQEKR